MNREICSFYNLTGLPFTKEIDTDNALTVLLCGQEILNQKFGLSILEPLANSISISVSINSLPKKESFSYIEQRVTSKI